MKKNVLITGAGSPFGRFASKYLKELKGFKVFGLSHSRSKISNFDFLLKNDLRKDNEIFNDKFDFIFHFASAVPAKFSSEEDFRSINIDGSLNLFSKINLNDNAVIFNASSLSVYDEKISGLINESSKKTEENFYGKSKLVFEKELKKFFESKRVSLISARIPVLIVPEVRNNFISKWRKSILEGKKIQISNPNKTFNALVDGKSLIDLVVNNNFENKKISINVGSDETSTFYEIAKTMGDFLDLEVKFDRIETTKHNKIISNLLASSIGYKVPNSKDIIKNFLKSFN